LFVKIQYINILRNILNLISKHLTIYCKKNPNVFQDCFGRSPRNDQILQYFAGWRMMIFGKAENHHPPTPLKPVTCGSLRVPIYRESNLLLKERDYRLLPY